MTSFKLDGSKLSWHLIRQKKSVNLSMLLTLLLFFLLISPTSSNDPNYRGHYCGDTNYTANSTYQTNLNTLLSTLLQSNTTVRFRSFSSGQNSDRVNGLVSCRGDVSLSTCQDCVTFATREATRRCKSRGYIVWYDECLLHYFDLRADLQVFSNVNTAPSLQLRNETSVTNAPVFNQMMLGLMNRTASQAVVSPERFATREGNYGNETVYCLVQCTQDLSSGDCGWCLRFNFENSNYARVGGSQLFPSCYSRFEFYQFYANISQPEAEPAPAPFFRRLHGCDSQCLVIE